MQPEQARIAPLTVSVINIGDEGFIEVGLGRDMVVTFRRSRIVMLEVNGLQFAPISMDQHTPWFKALFKGGLDPVMKDAPEIERMVLNYLFDAAIKTRLGEGESA
jgi:hypothetical protein